MPDDSGGFDLRGALDNADPVETIRTALGLTQTAHVCPDCGVACEQDHTFDVNTASFHNGETPCWTCPDCGKQYHREPTEDQHAVDLYGR